jgi:putative endonuclease
MKQYFVYIMASFSRKTYVGITSNLERRVWQHKTGEFGGHTSKYRKHRLVYMEEYQWVNDAIAREKQLKGWDRQKKVALIELLNPDWDDLSAGWYGVNPKVGVGLSTDGQSSQAGA